MIRDFHKKYTAPNLKKSYVLDVFMLWDVWVCVFAYIETAS